MNIITPNRTHRLIAKDINKFDFYTSLFIFYTTLTNSINTPVELLIYAISIKFNLYHRSYIYRVRYSSKSAHEIHPSQNPTTSLSSKSPSLHHAPPQK